MNSNLSISPISLTSSRNPHPHPPQFVVFSGGDGGDTGGNSGGGGGGGDEGDEEEDGGGEDGEGNRGDAMLVLMAVGRALDSLPKDLAAAIEAGKVPGSIVRRYFELEKSPIFRWLLQFGGFKERLLADDLFLAKVAMECGVGIFTKVCLFFAFCLLLYMFCFAEVLSYVYYNSLARKGSL